MILMISIFLFFDGNSKTIQNFTKAFSNVPFRTDSDLSFEALYIKFGELFLLDKWLSKITSFYNQFDFKSNQFESQIPNYR